jgi:tripartite-type tricarboxylate transporter receptor subunit TctC
MRTGRRRLLGLSGALCLAPIAAARPQGAAWPSKPLRIIVPGGPGGATDIRGRWLADRLAPALGEPLAAIVRAENAKLGEVIRALAIEAE